MKLIKAYVASFGGLKDFKYDFTDGINTIKQDNGFGKTTFATFIKCMFYGITKTGNGIDKSERKKYKPWNSTEKFGGYLVFEHSGKVFRVERFFGSKSSEDTFDLYDEVTGKKIAFEGSLGDRVFKIDEEGFLSTTYYAQKDFEVTNNTSITTKFNEVYGVQDSNLFDKAISDIDAKIKKYKTTGNRGVIPTLKADISTLGDKIYSVEKMEPIIDGLKDQIVVLEKEGRDLQIKAKEMRARIERASKSQVGQIKKTMYERAIKERQKNIDEINDANGILKEKTPSDERISSVRACIDDYKYLLHKKEDLINAKPIENKSNTKISLVFFAIAIMCLLTAVITVFMPNAITLAIAFFVVALVFVLAGIIAPKSGKKNEQFNAYNLEYQQHENKILEYENALNSFFNDFNVGAYNDLSEKLRLIETSLEIRKKAEESLKNIEKEISSLEKDEDLQAFSEEKVENTTALQEEADALDEMLADKRRLYSDLLNKYNTYQSELDKKIDLENEKEELERKRVEAEKDYKLLTLTLQFLEDADLTLKTNMRAPLENSLNKYLALLTGEDMLAKIDVDLNVSVEEKGLGRETEYYSKGYRNVFEICKRFALIDVLFSEEKPFIILDDPFYNLDDKKIGYSIELLKKLEKEYQILYLVCHDSRVI